MALPLGTVGSLRPTFVPARRVGLAVKLPSAFALEGQSPSGSRKPWHASVTFCEGKIIYTDTEKILLLGTQKKAAGTDAQTHEQMKLTQVAYKAMKVRRLRFKLGKKLH
nr:hypothetical protein [Tanacetum cinerariifolium]